MGDKLSMRLDGKAEISLSRFKCRARAVSRSWISTSRYGMLCDRKLLIYVDLRFLGFAGRLIGWRALGLGRKGGLGLGCKIGKVGLNMT